MKQDLKNKEHKLFNKLSKEWWDENGKFRVLHQIRPIRIQYILDQLDSNGVKNLDILDIGCGGGLVCESLSKLGGKITGIDFVKNNIEVARLHSKEKNLKIDYQHGNIEKIKINKKFDLIIMFEVLEHLNEWEFVLSRIKNNLKKNGIVIISTINRNFLSKLIAIYFAENFLRWIPVGTHNFNKLIKPEEIELLMEKNNMKLINLRGLVFDVINFEWKLSSNTNINYFCTYKNIS